MCLLVQFENDQWLCDAVFIAETAGGTMALTTPYFMQAGICANKDSLCVDHFLQEHLKNKMVRIVMPDESPTGIICCDT